MTTDPFTLACSFCGRTQHEVTKLVAGPGVFICDTCVGLAADIVATSTEPATPLAERSTEDLRPILEGLEAAQHRNVEVLDRWRAALSDR